MTTICTTTTLDCPTEVLTPWVAYHLNIGIDHMFLFFDNPEHPGIAAVEGDPRITVIRCDAAYWPGGAAKREKLTLHERQWFNANKGLALAKEREISWIVHLDSDELLHFKRPLQEILASVSERVQIIRFRVYEAVHESVNDGPPFQGFRIFKVGPATPTRQSIPRRCLPLMGTVAQTASYYLRLFAARLLCLSWIRRPFLWGHIGGKSAVRTTASIRGMGVHVPKLNASRWEAPFAKGTALLHFDAINYGAWKKKWLGRREERCIPRGRDRKRKLQLAQFIRACSSGQERDLERLFLRQYGLTPWQRWVLFQLGLLVAVRLDPGLFAASGAAPNRCVAETSLAVRSCDGSAE